MKTPPITTLRRFRTPLLAGCLLAALIAALSPGPSPSAKPAGSKNTPPAKGQRTQSTPTNDRADLATGDAGDMAALAARLLATAGLDAVSAAAQNQFELIESLARLAQETPDRIFALLQECSTLDGKLLLARVLAHIGTTDSMELLLRAALQETDPAAREILASAIGEASSRESLLAATSALAATNDPALVAAIRDLISRQADAETVQFLAELGGENESVPGQRRNVQEAVASIRQEEAVTALGILAAKNPDPILAQAAMTSLGKIGNSEAIQALAHGFRHAPSPEIAQQFLSHLGALTNPEGTQMIASLLENAADAELYGRLEHAWTEITGRPWTPGQVLLPEVASTQLPKD